MFGSWELTGIVSAQSGGPLTLQAGRDAALTGLGTDRAQYLGGDAYGSGACKNIAPCVSYLNTPSFGVPAAGNFGNAGKGLLSGPNFVNWDFGVFKNIPVSRAQLRLRFQSEFSNRTTRGNLGNP